MRSAIVVGAVLAWSAAAYADAASCKPDETQPECFARLKCKPDEELADCQKRLRAAAGANGGGQQQNGGGGDRGGGDRGGGGDRDYDRRSGDGGYRRSRGGMQSHSSFVANKTFGLGLELGEPTGVTGKVFVSPSGAIDFGLGYIYGYYYYGDGVHIYADYLWHPTVLASTPTFELPFYIGVGGRYWNFDYCRANVCTYGGSAFGVRVPIGIDFDFNNVPLDIFVQLVPVLDFLSGDYYTYYGNREHFGVDFSLGLRYWFK